MSDYVLHSGSDDDAFTYWFLVWIHPLKYDQKFCKDKIDEMRCWCEEQFGSNHISTDDNVWTQMGTSGFRFKSAAHATAFRIRFG